MTIRGKFRVITQSDMDKINRSAILEFIRQAGAATPAEIMTALHLDEPTATRMIDALIGDNLVAEDDTEKAHDAGYQKLLVFNGKDHLVIGIDLGGTKIYGAVANLNGDMLHEIHRVHGQSQAETSFQVVCEVLDELLRIASTITIPVAGVGIGVPGVVSSDHGMVSLAPALNWTEFPLLERLRERYPSLPVAIENDVNLAALGEYWFGMSEKITNLVLLAVGTGIGGGIILNGEIFRGTHDLAGEVGYFLPDRSCLGKSYPDFGAIELLASGKGIAERAKTVLKGTLSLDEIQKLTAPDVFAAARDGQAWAEAILKDTEDSLALLIGSLSLCYDPDCIMLSGGVALSSDLLIPDIRKRLEPSLPILPDIRVSKLGYRASIMGSVMQVLRIRGEEGSCQ